MKEESYSPGLFIIISGPSGVGKNTVLQGLLKLRPDLHYSISATTRPPRGQEEHGIDYYFLSEAEFKEEIKRNGFLEWAKIYDCFYGTPRRVVQEKLSAGRHVVSDVDIQGAIQIKRNLPEAILVFLYPPSFEELKARLLRRNTEDAESINKRLRYIKKELSSIDHYDYIVENDLLKEAVRKIESVIIAEESRVKRGYWKKFIKEFDLDKLPK